MNRFLLASLVILSCTLSVALLDSSSVSAASPYDDVIEMTDSVNLTVKNDSNVWVDEDLTNDYIGIMQGNLPDRLKDDWQLAEYGETGFCGNQFSSDLNNHFELMRWSVVQTTAYNPGQSFYPHFGVTRSKITLMWTTDLVKHPKFVTNGNYKFLAIDSTVNTCTIFINSAGDLPTPSKKGTIYVQSQLPYSGIDMLENDVYYTPLAFPEYDFYGGYEFASVRPLFINMEIDFPQDYQGIIPPDSYSPPIVRPTSTDVPDVRVPTVLDYKAVMYDANYYTTDQYDHDVCLNGLSPMVNWSLRDSTGEFILASTFHLSATLPFEVDLTKLDRQPQDGKYLVIASYYCGDEDTDPDFTEYTEVYFNVDEHGSLQIDFFEDCLIGEFPFIDFPACYANVMRVLNLLAFNNINFTGLDQFQRDPGCRSLQVLGGWIHKPGVTVCPMFPQYVRSTVTPFITFAFGLMMLKFITSRGGSGI